MSYRTIKLRPNVGTACVVVVALSALLSLTGCVTQGSVVRTRALNDLSCDEKQIEVVNIGGTSYRARGCGQEATYNCMTGPHEIICQREEQHAVSNARP